MIDKLVDSDGFKRAKKIKDLFSVGIFYYGLYWIPIAILGFIGFLFRSYFDSIAAAIIKNDLFNVFLTGTFFYIVLSLALIGIFFLKWHQRNNSEVLNIDAIGLERQIEYEVLPNHQYRYKRKTKVRSKIGQLGSYVDRIRWSGTREYKVIEYAGAEFSMEVVQTHPHYDFAIFTFIPYLQHNDEATIEYELLIHDKNKKGRPHLVVDNKRIHALKNEVTILFPLNYIGKSVVFSKFYDSTIGKRLGKPKEIMIKRQDNGEKGIVHISDLGKRRLRFKFEWEKLEM